MLHLIVLLAVFPKFGSFLSLQG
uniref:Uncharacterized protein n=1 Tax=Arundo donax TaxID=35708 RepID=A0A0A8ZFB9_ARUDO